MYDEVNLPSWGFHGLRHKQKVGPGKEISPGKKDSEKVTSLEEDWTSILTLGSRPFHSQEEKKKKLYSCLSLGTGI